MRKFLPVVVIIFAFLGCMQSGSNNKEKIKERNKIPNMKEKHIVSEHIKKRCDIDIVLETDENMANLSDNLIYLFLYSFDESCNNNAEFIEYSNEVLFKLLIHYPEEIATNIIKEDINQKIILNELSSPINDGINVNEVIKSVKKSNIDKIMKKKFITALKGGV